LTNSRSDGVRSPDFYVAAIGRSGSTMLCNWLSRPPAQLVFVEPFFTRARNPELLRIQLEDFGLAPTKTEWNAPAKSGEERFRGLMTPRLKGSRWAFKEVLCEEHLRVVEAFQPPRVVVTVRHIRDVALSFFEKHRLQGNLDRFSDRWVREYCLRETAGLVAFRDLLTARSIPFLIVRYEDFTASGAAQRMVADFVGWTPGGTVDAHMDRFRRGFEVQRHGKSISAERRSADHRRLDPELIEAAAAIERECGGYQAAFGYA
jgi:hypothetical protein